MDIQPILLEVTHTKEVTFKLFDNFGIELDNNGNNPIIASWTILGSGGLTFVGSSTNTLLVTIQAPNTLANPDGTAHFQLHLALTGPWGLTPVFIIPVIVYDPAARALTISPVPTSITVQTT